MSKVGSSQRNGPCVVKLKITSQALMNGNKGSPLLANFHSYNSCVSIESMIAFLLA